MFRPKPIKPQPGQESVWDYPRPPRVEPSSEKIRIVCNGEILAESENTYRVLETSHPPVYYLPPEDVKMEYLRPTSRRTYCEWKGVAQYYTVAIGEQELPNAAWCYQNPSDSRFDPIDGYIAVYPALMDACYVDEEQVQAQEGDFYGGWITSKIVGPFKGGTGTWGW
ncbi:DUF427 domain-containing protein [Spirulina sp. CS-785/01]|uniref:DUF427 domain-containing protein n=1 Tax=Spirulina sp. CS-785/01 TaxID=3021716 RepID=UPI00232ED5B7|nr:DUF427 domain-containing protein [Spirulina sp. CS-785/01]MDB9312986.1 DUF427 domain-containing protein [Spirulina sp. CS-785/01]